MTKRMENLLAYFDRLIEAEKSDYRCTKEISEVIAELRNEVFRQNDCDKERYEERIRTLAGSHYQPKFNLTNEMVYTMYQSKVGGEFTFPRTSGLSTSIGALTDVFDDVIYIKNRQTVLSNTDGKVIFVDPGVELPRGLRYECLYKLSQFEVISEGKKDAVNTKFDAVIAR